MFICDECVLFACLLWTILCERVFILCVLTATSPLSTTWAAAAASYPAPEHPRNGECGRSSQLAVCLRRTSCRLPLSTCRPYRCIAFAHDSFYCVLFPKCRHLHRRLRTWSRRGVSFLFPYMILCVFLQYVSQVAVPSDRLRSSTGLTYEVIYEVGNS